MVLYIMKYFAIQVQTTKEDFYIELVSKQLDFRSEKQDFIFLKRCLPIRKKGIVNNELKPIFPGYIFIKTDEIDSKLYTIMKSTQYFVRFLPENQHICNIQSRDLNLLEHFLRLGNVAKISTVFFDENQRIIVKEGPLKGLEGSIIKVDKRKQRAKIALDFANTQFAIDLAFEIIEKNTNQ